MDNMNIFDVLYDSFTFTKPIRLIECFAGYGSQAMAFKKLQDEGLLKSESWKICEWEYHAICSYYELHCSDDRTDYSKDMTKDELLAYFKNSGISADGKIPMTLKQINRKGEKWVREIYNKIRATKNLVDITKIHSEDLEIVEKDKYQYLFTYSFPCQDISMAGKKQGMDKGSSTKSSLLWEVERIINECYQDKCLPDVLLMENVPDVINAKNYNNFMKWYVSLEACGYQSYYCVLNAKHYGIPQNRNRAIMVSLLGKYNYTFPDKIPLTKNIASVLEPWVAEKYFLSAKEIEGFKRSNAKNMRKGNGFMFKPTCGEGIANAITTRAGSIGTDNFIKIAGYLDNYSYESSNRVYDTTGISPTITTRESGKSEIKIVADGITLNQSTGYSRGVLKGLSRCIKTRNAGVVVNDVIRKLTPTECGRLMGVSDANIEKMKRINSDSQLYKQFGNSIVVDVLYYVFKQMTVGKPMNESDVLKDVPQQLLPQTSMVGQKVYCVCGYNPIHGKTFDRLAVFTKEIKEDYADKGYLMTDNQIFMTSRVFQTLEEAKECLIESQGFVEIAESI